MRYMLPCVSHIKRYKNNNALKSYFFIMNTLYVFNDILSITA